MSMRARQVVAYLVVRISLDELSIVLEMLTLSFEVPVLFWLWLWYPETRCFPLYIFSGYCFFFTKKGLGDFQTCQRYGMF